MKFKDFFDEEVPSICLQLGLKDLSWHNDAAARMEVVEGRIFLWVFPKDPKLREFPDAKRFLLSSEDGDEMLTIIETDSEAKLLEAIRIYVED